MAESQLQAGEKAPSEVDKVSRRRKRILTINLMACKYQSVKRMARRFGFKISNESSDVSLLWSDCSISIDKSMEIKPYQKINHFPGMNEICRKDSLARNMNRMRKLFPADYHFFPRTWCLPADFSELESYAQSKKNMTFIVKPDNGAQGKGIFLTRNVKGINRGEHVVCQQYIGKVHTVCTYVHVCI
jgi:tubulin polyglutamylase TTLL6/13